MYHNYRIRISEQRWKLTCVMGAAVLFVLTAILENAKADIVIIDRESSGRVGVFAGSGGALVTDESMDSMAAFTGMFNFSDSLSATVTTGSPFSNGAAESSGAISVQNNVTQAFGSMMTMTSNRSSSGSAHHTSGTGNANTSQQQEFRVRFDVTDNPVYYSLTGSFDPGDPSPNSQSIRLHRPFTANEFFSIDSPGLLNESGILRAGRTYEFKLQLNDQFAANAGNPGPDAGFSSHNLQFNVTTIPEPGSCTLLLSALMGFVLTRRRRK